MNDCLFTINRQHFNTNKILHVYEFLSHSKKVYSFVQSNNNNTKNIHMRDINTSWLAALICELIRPSLYCFSFKKEVFNGLMVGCLIPKRFHLRVIIFGYRNNFSDAKRDWRLLGCQLIIYSSTSSYSYTFFAFIVHHASTSTDRFFFSASYFVRWTKKNHDKSGNKCQGINSSFFFFQIKDAPSDAINHIYFMCYYYSCEMWMSHITRTHIKLMTATITTKNFNFAQNFWCHSIRFYGLSFSYVLESFIKRWKKMEKFYLSNNTLRILLRMFRKTDWQYHGDPIVNALSLALPKFLFWIITSNNSKVCA